MKKVTHTSPQPQPLPVRIGAAAACQFLGVTVKELQRLRKAGRIPFFRIGHRTVSFLVSDLEAFMQACRVPARGAST